MMLIRPVGHEDLPQLLAMAEKTGGGLTSLPVDRATLAARIERSVQTWQGVLPRSEQGYVFVMADIQDNRAIGVCAIEVAVGLQEPWYNYHISNQVHASKKLNVYNSMPTLTLSNDHTGCSEVCTLFLDPTYRTGKNGNLLSKSRFLFMAAFRDRFASRIVAEMRGVSDTQGYSPFWHDVGQRFFSMSFREADYLSGTGQKAFIAELMPKHPLYIDYLSAEAKAVIGQTHPHTVPARTVLESEGFRYHNYIDIFDGGPTLECETQHIRVIRKSRLLTVELTEHHDETLPLCLVANDNYHQFRATLLRADPLSEKIAVDTRALELLQCQPGDRLRVVKLCLEDKT
ncbi:arginine N-succinyltransferase [Enterobacteriaceae bacterium LUAb1]